MTGVTGPALALLTAWLPPNDAEERPQMQVCSIDETGGPDARTVLLSEWDAEGFVFHTDSASRKAAQLAARPQVALVVLWPGFSRQLTVQGDAAPVTAEEAAAAYARRSPYLRQLAWQNTRELAQAEREVRIAAWTAFGAEHDVAAIDAPATWVGYRVRPQRLTFWESDPAGPSHRTEYRRGGSGWTASHLAG